MQLVELDWREKEMWELSDVITDIWSASEQQGDTPAGSDPAESSPDQKQGLPSLPPSLHEDTDSLFHQLTLDPAYDERPKLALAAFAENSTAPISPLNPPAAEPLCQTEWALMPSWDRATSC